MRESLILFPSLPMHLTMICCPSRSSSRTSRMRRSAISEIADRRIRDVRDELKEGQQIMVKCIGKEGNKIKLSRKAVLRDENLQADAASSHE